MELAAYSTVAMTLGLVVTRPRLSAELRITPAMAAFFGVTIMMLLGIIEPAHFERAALNLWSPFVAIGAIMIMTDVALRIGPLQDSSLRARKVLDFRRIVVASPSYLARHPAPRTPADLAAHNCLGFNIKASLNEWPFIENGRSFTQPVSGNFRANNGDTLRDAVLAGGGVARLGSFMVDDDIRAGRLVPLLEGYHPNDTLSVFAVFFRQK